MKITEVAWEYVEIPFPREFRPTWFPGGVEGAQGAFIVRVATDEGVEGIASAEAPFGLAPLLAAMVRYAAPLLVGRSPFDVERLTWSLRHVARVVTRPWAIENALWDIVGKAAGLPVSSLFGRFRERVPVYAAWGELRPPEQRVEDALRLVEEGFKAVKLRLHHQRLEDDIALVQAVRGAVGDRLTIMADANQGTAPERLHPSEEPVVWSYRRARDTARALGELGVAWLEEPLYRYDFAGLARLAAEVDIDIAGGEINRGFHEFDLLLRLGCYDIIQPNCTMSEGLSQIRKIAGLAEAAGKVCNPHAWIPGVGLAASIHLAATIPNLTWLEYPWDPPCVVPQVFQGVLTAPIEVERDGCVAVPCGPGFGVALNEEVIRRYRVEL